MDRFIHHPSHYAREAFTLIELLVVIAIIGLLAAMLTPAVTDVFSKAEQTMDHNNMKQIVTMYMSDRTDSRQTWAFPRANPQFSTNNGKQPLIDGGASDSNGIDVTNISLFTLAARTQLSPELFNSQSSQQITGIANHMRKKESEWTSDDISGWTSPVSGALNSTDIPYALDWSAPKSAGTARILIAMRDPLVHEFVPVVYADSHIGKLDYDPATLAAINTMVTPLDADGAAVDGLIADDIYTETGDILESGGEVLPRHLWIGRGDILRTHVK